MLSLNTSLFTETQKFYNLFIYFYISNENT